jgi:hypothetical protein
VPTSCSAGRPMPLASSPGSHALWESDPDPALQATDRVMSQPTSFRLRPDVLERIGTGAASHGIPVSALVTSLLDEGLKTRRFPGIASMLPTPPARATHRSHGT